MCEVKNETLNQPKKHEIMKGFHNIKFKMGHLQSENPRLRKKFPLKQGLQVFNVKDNNNGNFKNQNKK